MNIKAIVDLYQQRKEEREAKLLAFFETDKQPFIVMQKVPGQLWGECNTIE
jgi:hypothetical protein